jgi:hypothetical protein
MENAEHAKRFFLCDLCALGGCLPARSSHARDDVHGEGEDDDQEAELLRARHRGGVSL